MSEYSVVKDLPKELWDYFLEKSSDGNFEQCFAYGEISKEAFPKASVARLACMHGDTPVGILQGIYSRYLGFGMTLNVIRSPVVNLKDKNFIHIAETLLKALEEHAKRNRIIEARILVPDAWNIDEAFYSCGYSLVEKLNEYVVNLENGASWLWKNISHNKRRNIKKAMKSGVEVVESRNMRHLMKFYSMLKAAEKRRGFLSYPLPWFKAALNIYDPNLSRIFLAYWNGKAVSGVFTVIHNKTVFALAAGSFSEGWKVRPNDILHWKAMEWACQKGYSWYHMGLVPDPLPTEGSNAWGIWRWKREWNGKLKSLKIFSKVFLPRYTLMLKAKKFVEKAYGLLRG